MQRRDNNRSLTSIDCRVRRRIRPVLAVFVLALPVAGVHAMRASEPDAPSPVEGHAEVIAQGVARMPDSEVAWRLVEREAPVTPDQARPEDLGLGFVLANEEAILLRAGGERYRLAPGEAFLVEDGDEPQMSGLGERSTHFYSIELLPANDIEREADGRVLYRGRGFDVEGRDFDLDLVRDVLTQDEESTLPDTDYPVLIAVTDGTLNVDAGGEREAKLEAGDASTFDGALHLTGLTAKTVFVAAVIGPELRTDATSEATAVPTTAPPTTEPAPQPTSAPPPAPTETPAGNDPGDDPDGDGLTNADEDLRGTDRRDADSDDDGLTDGFEVFQSGTLPLDTDSDDDGLADGDEVNRGTNPSNADTDGDGLDDGSEVSTYGTDPKLTDTDGDAFSDGDEVNAGTDPNDPNSHP